MSTDPSILLRLLEPAVRPDGGKFTQGTGGPAPGAQPFEQTPFEKLLKDARGPAETAQLADNAASNAGREGQGTGIEKQADPLAKLGDMDRIENAALRQALANARPGPGPDATD